MIFVPPPPEEDDSEPVRKFVLPSLPPAGSLPSAFVTNEFAATEGEGAPYVAFRIRPDVQSAHSDWFFVPDSPSSPARDAIYLILHSAAASTRWSRLQPRVRLTYRTVGKRRFVTAVSMVDAAALQRSN